MGITSEIETCTPHRRHKMKKLKEKIQLTPTDKEIDAPNFNKVNMKNQKSKSKHNKRNRSTPNVQKFIGKSPDRCHHFVKNDQIMPLFSEVSEVKTGKNGTTTTNGYQPISPLMPPAGHETNGGRGVEPLQQQQSNTYFNGHKNYYSYPRNGQSHHQNQHNCPGDGGHRNHNLHHDHYHQNNRYLRRDLSYEISQRNQFQFPNFFHPTQEAHHIHGTRGPLNSVFNPGPHSMYSEIQLPIPDPSKPIDLSYQHRSIGWIYNGQEGMAENCVSMSVSERRDSNVQNGRGYYGQNGHKRRSIGNRASGNHQSRVTPTYTFFRRNYGFGYGRGLYSENRPHFYIPRLEELMDRFHYVEDSEKPEQFAPIGHEFAKLSEQIWTKFQSNQQTVETYRRKIELWKEMADCVRKYNSSYRLELVGSTLTGFGSNSSDVDMCLILNHRNNTDPRAEAIDILESICPSFELIPHLVKTELILAKVPILKLHEDSHGIDVDINVNNAVGLRNTHLLYSYSQCDWRLRPLVIVVKLWAQAQGINDAKMMTLSSYSLALMVIHFLQQLAPAPVLPCLQLEYPDMFSHVTDLWRNKANVSDSCWNGSSENSQSLGELLVGFLEYFAVKFEYRVCAISVRTGSTVSVRNCSLNNAPKNDVYQWKHICIEEPFEHTNTARSVYDKDAFDRIRGVFVSSWQRLLITHDLDSIFQAISPGGARAIGARAKQ